MIVDELLEAQLHQRYLQEPSYAAHFSHAFELGETLGEGGMGTVYRAFDKRLGRSAALKLIHREGEIDSLVRFKREAKIMSQLVHPCIPAVYECGVTPAGQHYLLMEEVKGSTLGELIRRYHEDEKTEERRSELLHIMVRVCEALAYAHSKGIIHRDLKPENIMVGDFGEVFVMDWGLARVSNEDEDGALLNASVALDMTEASQLGLTESGAILGTPGYMAPEQILGERVEGRADLYALGTILTVLLTGELPVKGAAVMDRLLATIHGKQRSPRELDASIPTDLDELVRRALDANPEARQRNPEELKQELLRHLRGKAASAKSPVVFLLLFFLIVILSGGFIYLERMDFEDTRSALEAKKNEFLVLKDEWQTQNGALRESQRELREAAVRESELRDRLATQRQRLESESSKFKSLREGLEETLIKEKSKTQSLRDFFRYYALGAVYRDRAARVVMSYAEKYEESEDQLLAVYCLKILEKYKESLRILSQLMERSPDCEEAFLLHHRFRTRVTQPLAVSREIKELSRRAEGNSSTALSLYAKALIQFSEKDLARTKQCLEEMKKRPGYDYVSGEYELLEAAVLQREKKYFAALTKYQSAKNRLLFPRYALQSERALLEKMTRAGFPVKDFKQISLDLLEEAIELGGGSNKDHSLYGRALVKLGEYSAGLVKLGALDSQFKRMGDRRIYDRASNLSFRAMALWHLKGLEEVEVMNRRSLALKRTLDGVFVQGFLAIERGNLKQGAEVIEELASQRGWKADVAFLSASLALAKGVRKKARLTFEALLKKPYATRMISRCDLQFFLGRCYARERRYEEAKKWLRLSLIDRDVSIPALLELASCYLELGDTRAAELELKKIKSLGAESESYYQLFASLYTRQKQQKKALALLIKALRGGSKPKRLLLMKIETALFLGEKSMAKRDLSYYLTLYPNSLKASFLLAKVKYLNGEKDKARSKLEELLIKAKNEGDKELESEIKGLLKVRKEEREK